MAGSAIEMNDLAGSAGRVAGVLERTAAVTGLSKEALSGLGDVADLAELGLNNVSKSAAGFNAASLGVVGAGLAAGTAIGTWIASFPGVQKVVDSLRDSVVRLWTGMDPADKVSAATAGLKEWQAQIAAADNANRKMQIQAAGGLEVWVKGAIEARDRTKDLEAASGLVGRTIKDIDEARAILRVEQDTKKATEAMRKLGEETRRARDALFGSLETEARRGSMEREEASVKALEADLAKAEGAATALSMAIEQGQLDERTRDAAQAAEEMARSYGDAAEEARALGKVVAAPGFGATLKQALAGLPQAIMGAIQGGGSVGGSIGALFGSSVFGDGSKLLKDLTGKFTGLFGKTIGGALGAVLPGLGTLLGEGLGKLAGKAAAWVGGLFGKGEISKVNDMRDAFFEVHGGFEAFSREMAKVSDQDWARKIFNAKTVEEFNRLVAEAQGLLGQQKMAQEAVNEAVDRWDFSISELGPHMAAQELDKKAQGLFRDWELLTKGALIPADSVIQKMGPDLLDFVNQSKAAGVAIPQSMRPMVEELIRSGQLLDENGQAFTSVEDAGISFAESLTEGMRAVVEEVRNLIAALTGVPVAARQAGDAVAGIPAPPFGGDYGHPDTGRPYGANGEGLPGFARGTPYVPFTMPAMVHRGEAIVPREGGGSSALNQMAAKVAAEVNASRGGGPTHVHVHIGDREVQELIVDATGRAVLNNTGGLTTNLVEGLRRRGLRAL